MRPRSVRLASRRPSRARKRGRSLAPFAAPLSARLLRYRLKSDAERVKHFEHRSKFRRCVLAPIQASARHAGLARDLRHVTGARHVLDRAQDEPAIESLERLGEIVGNHLGIIEVTGRVEWRDLDHVSLLLAQLAGERLGLRDVPSLRSLVASEQHHVAVAELRVVDALSRTNIDAHFAHPLPDPAHVATIAFEQAVEPRQYRCPTALIPQPLEPALEGLSALNVRHVFYRRQCSGYKGVTPSLASSAKRGASVRADRGSGAFLKLAGLAPPRLASRRPMEKWTRSS